jgi:hypothetical protein
VREVYFVPLAFLLYRLDQFRIGALDQFLRWASASQPACSTYLSGTCLSGGSKKGLGKTHNNTIFQGFLTDLKSGYCTKQILFPAKMI